MSTFDFEDSPRENYGEGPPAYTYEQQEQDGDRYDEFGDGDAQARPAPPPANGLLDDDFVTAAAEDGPKLPDPIHMEPEESLLLREWRQKKAAELEEKSRISQEKHAQILDEAKKEQEEFYKKRETNMSQLKINNREKERAFMTNLENLNAKAGSNYWEAVTGFINFDSASGKKDAKKKAGNEPQRTSTLLNDAKPGKHTDKARMRQILLKLKHSPPIRAA